MESLRNSPSGYVKSVLDRVAESDLTDTELCRRAGIAQSTLSRIRNGTQSPTISTMDKIEAAIERESEMKRAGESSA